MTSSQPTLGDAESALRDIEQSVIDAEETLQRLTIEAEAVADKNLVAQAELVAAQREAEAKSAALDAAQAAVGRTQEDVAALGRQSYMGADAYGSAAAFFSAGSAEEVLQRAATLQHLGDDRAEQLDQLEMVEREQQAATEAAKAALDARDAAAQAAEEAERVANEQLATAQHTYDAAVGQKATLEQQLREARDRVRSLGGAAAPVASSASAEQAAQGGPDAPAAGIPTSGRVTSCYGARWGTTHLGVDIANAIGTPIYAPEAGTVLQAGPASGFGLAVYLQHADGSITVYGHINQYFVQAGQQVAAGQQIAEIGNKGQSTGAHLHFEVHLGGLYQNRVNPVPWLAARGISLGGGCG